MTNQEYFELNNEQCEDCQWYGSKCHCQYEQEEATMQDWYDRGFKFGLSEGEHRLTQANNIIRDLQWEIVRLNQLVNDLANNKKEQQS